MSGTRDADENEQDELEGDDFDAGEYSTLVELERL